MASYKPGDLVVFTEDLQRISKVILGVMVYQLTGAGYTRSSVPGNVTMLIMSVISLQDIKDTYYAGDILASNSESLADILNRKWFIVMVREKLYVVNSNYVEHPAC